MFARLAEMALPTSPAMTRSRCSRIRARRANMPDCSRSAAIMPPAAKAHRNVCLIPSSAHGTNPASAHMAGMEVVVVACDARGDVDVADLRAKAEQHSAKSRRRHDHLSLDPRRVRGTYPRDLRHRACARRTGLSRRRQSECAGRPRPARRIRRRCQPSQPAQDLLHSAWRRRPRHGADRRQGALDAVPAGSSRERRQRRRSGVGRALRLGFDPHHFLHLHPDDGRRRADARDRSRGPQRQLHRRAAGEPFPGAVPQRQGPRRA